MKFPNLLNHMWRKPEIEPKATNSTLADLCNLHVLRSENYPCEKCTIGNDYCKKLHFSNCTICVTPKDKINLFSVSKRKSIRKSNKL